MKNWASNSNGISWQKERPIVSKPCPGLTPTNIPRDLREKLATYFIRSPVPGGGGPNLNKVTEDLFPGKEYRFLTAWEKNAVRSAQRQRYQWLNNADIETVFSTSCTKVVHVREGVDHCALHVWKFWEIGDSSKRSQYLYLMRRTSNLHPRDFWMRQPLSIMLAPLVFRRLLMHIQR